MSLIQCPECGREVSDKSAACPHCGYPISGETKHENSNTQVEAPTKEKPGILQTLRRPLFSAKIGPVTVSLNIIGNVTIILLFVSVALILPDIAYFRVVFEVSSSKITQAIPYSYYNAVHNLWSLLPILTILVGIAAMLVQLTDFGRPRLGRLRLKVIVTLLFAVLVLVGFLFCATYKDISGNGFNCVIFVRRKAAWIMVIFAILSGVLAAVG